MSAAGQLARRALLERVAARAGVQPADQQLDVARARVEHDAPLRVGVEQLAGEVDARLVAEPDVDQRDVRLAPLDQLPALAGGARRADDLASLAAEQQLETFAEGLVVFDEDEARVARSRVRIGQVRANMRDRRRTSAGQEGRAAPARSKVGEPWRRTPKS